MKPVKVKINGKVYKFKYTINSLCELEETTQYKDMSQLMAASQAGSIAAVRAMVWAGLIWDNPDLTIDEVGESMGDLQGMQKFADAVGKAFVASVPDVPKDEDEDDKAADPTK